MTSSEPATPRETKETHPWLLVHTGELETPTGTASVAPTILARFQTKEQAEELQDKLEKRNKALLNNLFVHKVE